MITKEELEYIVQELQKKGHQDLTFFQDLLKYCNPKGELQLPDDDAIWEDDTAAHYKEFLSGPSEESTLSPKDLYPILEIDSYVKATSSTQFGATINLENSAQGNTSHAPLFPLLPKKRSSYQPQSLSDLFRKEEENAVHSFRAHWSDYDDESVSESLSDHLKFAAEWIEESNELDKLDDDKNFYSQPHVKTLGFEARGIQAEFDKQRNQLTLFHKKENNLSVEATFFGDGNSAYTSVKAENMADAADDAARMFYAGILAQHRYTEKDELIEIIQQKPRIGSAQVGSTNNNQYREALEKALMDHQNKILVRLQHPQGTLNKGEVESYRTTISMDPPARPASNVMSTSGSKEFFDSSNAQGLRQLTERPRLLGFSSDSSK